jgi:predicted XRE-type DNA-binding protein
MAKSRKTKSREAKVRWPDEKELSLIREQLSSGTVQGSRVLGTDASLVDRIKQNLCSKIVEFHARSGVSQKELAHMLRVDEPEMSRILHYHIERYSIDRLISYLELLYPNVRFEVSAA